MKYYRENENVRMEYDVILDVAKLEKIIKTLDEECSNEIKKTARVTSSSIEEALAKITTNDKSSINFTQIFDALELGSDYDFLKAFTKPQFVFEYEFNYVQPSYLAYLLRTILSNNNTNTDMTSTLNLLFDYENSEELNSYKEKMANEGITQETYFKYELLSSLYQAARDSIKGKLVCEVIHYENDEKDLGKRL